MLDKFASLLQTPAAKHWQRVGLSHHHGVNIPLFSLHSEHSCGIGEYLDLKPLITWIRQIGFDTIQLLPLNDTGGDSSPYNSISAFALNPYHISLFPFLEQNEEKGLEQEFYEIAQKLKESNFEKRVNYPLVRSLKESFLRRYYHLYFTNYCETPSFKQFLQENSWLKGYALFKTLKEKFNGVCWQDWPLEYRHIGTDDAAIDKQVSLNQETVSFHIFCQYLAFNQMQEVKQHADAHQVLLKGDIPILVNRDSAEVWLNHRWFDLSHSAGSPPDMYSAEGQNWGFPIYNWEQLEKEDFALWRDRLLIAEKFYHLYRIDHVLGFFRIFAIPLDKTAKEGVFFPKVEAEWLPHGKKLLEMLLTKCSLLPIGEDLGDVPTSIKHALRELGIPGTKVTRWERNWNSDGSFISPKSYNPVSLSCVSTHDSELLRQWWQVRHDDRKAYARFKKIDDKIPFNQLLCFSLLQDSHSSSSLFHINLLQEYLSLIQSWTPLEASDERINTPGTVSDSNWSARVIPSIEQIISCQLLREKMHALLPQTYAP